MESREVTGAWGMRHVEPERIIRYIRNSSVSSVRAVKARVTILVLETKRVAWRHEPSSHVSVEKPNRSSSSIFDLVEIGEANWTLSCYSLVYQLLRIAWASMQTGSVAERFAWWRCRIREVGGVFVDSRSAVNATLPDARWIRYIAKDPG